MTTIKKVFLKNSLKEKSKQNLHVAVTMKSKKLLIRIVKMINQKLKKTIILVAVKFHKRNNVLLIYAQYVK